MVKLPKYGHGELNIHRPHITDKRYTIYVVFVRRREKIAERFQKVTTSQEHQTINKAVLY